LPDTAFKLKESSINPEASEPNKLKLEIKGHPFLKPLRFEFWIFNLFGPWILVLGSSQFISAFGLKYFF
jgi:hypothetical protein